MRTRSWSAETPLRVLAAFGVLLLAFTGQVQACTICLSAVTITPGQRLDLADQAVVALRLASNPDQFRVVQVVKGSLAAGDIISDPDLLSAKANVVMSPDGQMLASVTEAAQHGKPLLLVRNRVSESWTSIGSIDDRYAPWLRDLVATYRGKERRSARTWQELTLASSSLSDDEWRARVAVVAPQLESAEPLVAEIAYGEIARAPYAALLVLESQLDGATIATWTKDPKLVSRRSAYTLLLGIVGKPEDAIDLEREIDAALTTRDATNLSAMCAADLELRGPERVEWLERTFFADRQRQLPEIEAALLALSVHGSADQTVPRKRVVEAYRRFIRMRSPMAGFVALELADWKAWSLTQEYVDIIRSKAVKDPAGEFAILSYLKSSPITAQIAAVGDLAASNE